MRYAGLIKNDVSAAPGVCVSFFMQGCPHRCPGCHNPESWDFDGGMEFTPDLFQEIVKALSANGIQRNFCLMGGEPLCEENAFLSHMICDYIKKNAPEAKIYIWTGGLYEEHLHSPNSHIIKTLQIADYLIDGPYIAEQQDLSLPMRGSRNQRIIKLDNN